MNEHNDKPNDYALAKYLDERVVAIFALVADHQQDLPDLTDLNRSYVLLVNELKKLYSRNPSLNDIKETICWRTFDSIDSLDPYDLFEFSDDNKNHGLQHISKVNNLCIIEQQLTPFATPELRELLAEADKNIHSFADNWLIPEYTFDITEAGELLVNGVIGVMNVKKVQAGSASEMILTQAKEQPYQTFKPNLKGHSIERGIRTSLIEIGFTGAIEKLFMPVMDNQRGVNFRPKVKRAIANKERIDLVELDTKLKHLGADTILSAYSLFPSI